MVSAARAESAAAQLEQGNEAKMRAGGYPAMHRAPAPPVTTPTVNATVASVMYASLVGANEQGWFYCLARQLRAKPSSSGEEGSRAPYRQLTCEDAPHG